MAVDTLSLPPTLTAPVILIQFSQTLRICLFKANTLEAIAMSACTCGRSPTDNCVGWHNLTEDKYLEKKAAHEARKADKAT